MKLKCNKIISPATGKVLTESPWLHVGGEYIILAIKVTPLGGIKVCFQSDHYNEPMFSTLIGFEVISQHLPSNWTTKMNENNVYYMMPESWMYDDFFEELEDEKPKAIDIFNREAEIIYHEENAL